MIKYGIGFVKYTCKNVADCKLVMIFGEDISTNG